VPKKKYKAVIFDFDDTLVETREIKWAQYKFVARKFYNMDISKKVLLEHWGKPLHTLITEIFNNVDTFENLRLAVRTERNNFLKKVYTNSVNIVNELLENNIKVGILSATDKMNLEEDLIRLGFPVDRLIAMQGEDETPVHKPNPEVFLPIFTRLKKEGIGKKEIVYIGDSLDDLKAAKEAGIGFIAVTTGLYSKADFKKHGAKAIVKDIREVLKEIM